jgi:hypothetical protein
MLKHAKEKVKPQVLAGTVNEKSLKAEIKRLTKIVNKGGGGGTNNLNRLNTSRWTTYICHWCGETGHIKPNCPNLDKPQKGSGGQSTARANPPLSSASTNEFRTKEEPKPGEPLTKTNKGTQYKWCDTCKKWNLGDKAHHTVEHVKGTISKWGRRERDQKHGAQRTYHDDPRMLQWPGFVEKDLWPMAFLHAAYLYNITPNMETGVSPISIWTRTTQESNALCNIHTWCCRVYVLTPRLKDGQKIPKWETLPCMQARLVLFVIYKRD